VAVSVCVSSFADKVQQVAAAMCPSQFALQA